MIEANIPEEIIVKLCSSSLVDFIERVDANLIIRGLRSISDFELEFQKALMNKKMNKEVETILLASEPEFNYLTSNAVMEVSEFKNEVKKFVPENVQERIELKLN
jgi:pantetheine-phosphate adenylyltransferase